MGRHTPPEIQHLYFLIELIQLRNIEKYTNQFGLQPIDISLAREGKEMMGWGGDLSQFEKDTARYLNDEMERRERNEALSMRRTTALTVAPTPGNKSAGNSFA